MTTEDDFQSALDADPRDWQTRLVFADWLQERGDPRADGYRALGQLRFAPADAWVGRGDGAMMQTVESQGAHAWYRSSLLPPDWFDAIDRGLIDLRWKQFATRKDADDAAALAFANLSAERRVEVLTVG